MAKFLRLHEQVYADSGADLLGEVPVLVNVDRVHRVYPRKGGGAILLFDNVPLANADAGSAAYVTETMQEIGFQAQER